MSYPGRHWMADDITYYDENFQPQHYRPQTISNLIADLRRWGYLEHDQRGCVINGKPCTVAHYVTLTPELAYLHEEIAAWCRELRDKPKRQRPKSDLLTGEYTRNGACLTERQVTQNGSCLTDGKVTQEAGLLGEHRSNRSGLLYEHPNSPRESRKHAAYLEDSYLEEERGSDAPALPLNEIAAATIEPRANGSCKAPPQPRTTPSAAPSAHPPTPPKGKPGASAPADAEVDQALAAYNDAARRYGFTACQAFTKERRARLKKRLADIGGLERFKLALFAIPRNDWMMGRVPTAGRKPFKLDLEYLLQTDGKSGDVLGKLIDDAYAASAHPARNGAGQQQFVDMSADLVGSRRFLAHAGVAPDKPWPAAIGPQSYYHPLALSERGFPATRGSA
jgi:hypothetical protein